jgi:hypothetical protein
LASFKQATSSVYVSLDWRDLEQRLLVRHRDMPMLHECTESNTYVIDHTQLLEEEYYDIRTDLIDIDNTLVPYGQFGFFIYSGDGEFYLWAQSYQADTGRMARAFKSFGYTPSVLTPVQIHVSDKDLFKLKLKFGS